MCLHLKLNPCASPMLYNSNYKKLILRLESNLEKMFVLYQMVGNTSVFIVCVYIASH